MDVNGESAMATANAHVVLGARGAAMSEVTKAEAAQKAAEDALAEAMDLPADTANRESLINALEAAIEAAEEDVKTATDARDGDELKAAVAAVQNPTGVVDPAPDTLTTPADHGQDVAMAIGMALGPDTDGSGLRVTTPTARRSRIRRPTRRTTIRATSGPRSPIMS